MKHPKTRGDRLRLKANGQHKALRQDGRYRPQVVPDKRGKHALKNILEELDDYASDEIREHDQ